MEQTIISKRCPRCGLPLVKSDILEYVYQCFECDEDFYGFEANEVTVSFSEPTQEDAKPYIQDGFDFDIDFLERVKVEVKYNGHSGYSFIEREQIEKLGTQYIADHVKLEYSTSLEEYFVRFSENDYYNDTTRNPEKIIPVRFVGVENGTGREIYKGIENECFYLREVYYPRENCAKWFKCGKRRTFEDGYEVRPNLIFEHNGEYEKLRYDDWNGVMAYSDTFNKNFRKIPDVG